VTGIENRMARFSFATQEYHLCCFRPRCKMGNVRWSSERVSDDKGQCRSGRPILNENASSTMGLYAKLE
jgi:hypothetical protein